ncbi:MAG: 4-diphosphocytidyl-2C-methyl-D-erythritol synthase [Cyanobacteria bacterium SW_9_44_58]|nr:MAG: 4-diphosphocytidyl-2C-methyl-D-erythritol synthase [Cyanobacteria bacterium SW_9_44_58]
MGNIGIIILAAGASRRMGQPKQLLPYQGKSLIQHITAVAIDSASQPIVVVLGAYASLIAPKISDLNIRIAYNEQWSTGMASSLKFGLSKIQAITSHLDAVIVMLGDQPFVSTALIQQLVSNYRSNNFLIVASQYNNIVGVPALFHRALFPELGKIEGDAGAKFIIRRYYSSVLSIPFAEGAIDIDTPQDWKRLSE